MAQNKAHKPSNPQSNASPSMAPKRYQGEKRYPNGKIMRPKKNWAYICDERDMTQCRDGHRCQVEDGPSKSCHQIPLADWIAEDLEERVELIEEWIKNHG